MAEGLSVRCPLTSGNPVTVDPGQTPVQLVPLTPAEKAFETAHAASTGCTAATDQYCGVTFAFWAGPVVADPADGRVLFTYGKLSRGGATGTPCSGPLGKGLGTGIAAINMSTGQVTRLTATNGPDVTSVEGRDDTMFFPNDAGYSVAGLVADGDLYLYGNCDYDCRLARGPGRRTRPPPPRPAARLAQPPLPLGRPTTRCSPTRSTPKTVDWSSTSATSARGTARSSSSACSSPRRLWRNNGGWLNAPSRPDRQQVNGPGKTNTAIGARSRPF